MFLASDPATKIFYTVRPAQLLISNVDGIMLRMCTTKFTNAGNLAVCVRHKVQSN